MPSRILDGEIARSESLSKVSRDAALTFILLVSVADDHGRFDARPRAVLAALYGMRDDVTVAALADWLDELERENLICRYEIDQRPYLRLPTWFDYQRRRDSKSKYPDPPQESPPVDESAASCGELPRVAARARALRVPRAESREAGAGDAPPQSAAPDPEAPSGEKIADRFSPEAIDRLPDSFVSMLSADRPDLAAPPAHVRAWLRSVAPKMRAGRYRDLRRAATNWWQRATRDEVREAVERETFVAARTQVEAARASPFVEPSVAGIPLTFFETPSPRGTA